MGGTSVGYVNTTDPSYSLVDNIDGGKGTDTLYITLQGQAGTPVISDPVNVQNVEIIQARSTGNNENVFDASTLVGAEEILSYRSMNNLRVDQVQTFDIELGMYRTGTTNMAVKYAPGLVASTAAADRVANVNVNEVVQGGELSVASVTAMNIMATGANSRFTDIRGLEPTGGTFANLEAGTGVNTLKTINVTGDKNLRIDGKLQDTVDKIDASDFEGNLNVRLHEGVDTNIMGGAGDDVFRFLDNGLDANDTVDGGEGTNTIVLDDDTGNTAFTKISNIQVLQADNTANTKTYNMSVIDSLETLRVTANNPGADDTNVTATNVGDNVEVLSHATDAHRLNNLTLTTKDVNSTLNLKLDNSPTEAANTGININGAVTVNQVQTLNLESVGQKLATDTPANTNTVADLVGANLKTVNIDGDTALSVVSTAGNIEKVDASDFTGNLTFNLSNTKNYNIMTGSGNDTVIMTGAGSKAKVNLGEGDDKLQIALGILNKDMTLDGGEGTNTAYITGAALDLTTDANIAKLGALSNFQNLEIAAGTTLTLNDVAVGKFGGNEISIVANNAAGAGSTIEAQGILNSSVKVNYDASGNNIDAAHTYKVSNGVDNVKLTAEADTVEVTNAAYLAATDTIDAGAGADILDFSGGGTVTAGQLGGLKGFEVVQASDATADTKITIDDDFLASNSTATNTLAINQSAGTGSFTVDASGVSSTYNLTITGNAGAATAAAKKIDIKAGAGNDTISVGDVSDITTGSAKVDLSAGGENTIQYLNQLFHGAIGDAPDAAKATSITDFTTYGTGTTAAPGMDKLGFDIANQFNGLQITAAKFFEGNTLAGADDHNHSIVVLTGQGYASFDAANDVVEAATPSSNDYLLIFYNTSTQVVEMHFDADSADNNGIQLARFEDIGLAGLNGFELDNFVAIV